jgi:hypothetical protein
MTCGKQPPILSNICPKDRERHWRTRWAKKTYPQILTRKDGRPVEALIVRRCITKGGFAELRAACINQGGPLTGEFLDLEREIDNCAMQCGGRH